MKEQPDKRGYLVKWEARATGIEARVFVEDQSGVVVTTCVIGLPGRYLTEMLYAWEQEAAEAAQLELPW